MRLRNLHQQFHALICSFDVPLATTLLWAAAEEVHIATILSLVVADEFLNYGESVKELQNGKCWLVLHPEDESLEKKSWQDHCRRLGATVNTFPNCELTFVLRDHKITPSSAAFEFYFHFCLP